MDYWIGGKQYLASISKSMRQQTKATSQEATLGQIQKIEDRLKEIRKTLAERKQGVFKTGDPETRFNAFKEEWFNAHKEKADLLHTDSMREIERACPITT